ncbi:hypothetical protein ABFS82_03G050600 [Erythranthe guttata]|uniref:Dof zinc finger protein n=1 Tax=Erythranthe guttata TaxID=4155 RepID=A0A022RYJ7_ERYGU|nr:PREDICTED: dof zinc finger protein DOF1.6-like [Erythranthe guttata]EYU45071.1 hypothetical protein MIMGU_mgv1a017753mg [Erythranthe guttata]|eukprot:XP_012846496.1 PREDICTED: dof zinc finger protein DOF1.6-like [Erythranthe guttata]
MDPTTTPIPQPESGGRLFSGTAEHPPCPRCDSTDTKFCYYNNYNLSQPRHFCKSCRRYWTRGGALRKVPVGGGTRKSSSSSNKRRRLATPTAATATPRTSSSNNNLVVSCSSENDATAQSRYTDPVVPNTGPGPGSGPGSGYEHGVGVNLNEDAVAESGSVLSCWWSNTAGQMGSGGGLFPFVDGYGLGIGSGMGCGPDVLEWPPLEQVAMGGGDTDAAVVSGESTPVCSTWQMGGGGGEGGGAAETGDYFSWPDLAISTPAAKDVK